MVKNIFVLLLALLLSTAVVASPQDLRQLLEQIDADAVYPVAGAPLYKASLVTGFYHRRQHEPVWTGSHAAQRRLKQLIHAIQASANHGFLAERYHLAALSAPETAPSAKEVLATDAFLVQVEHRLNGVVNPNVIDPDWYLQPEVIDSLSLLSEAVDQNAIYPTLEQLWPQHAEYELLLKKRVELLASEDQETEQIAQGPVLKFGVSNERVVSLKKRLFGPGDYDAVFDDPLRGSVKSFQMASGLEPDGIVGADTVDLFNSTRFVWVDRIDANLERWRWLPRHLPATHIRVNIAAYHLWAFHRGQLDLTMKVIAGRPLRRTPVFTETLKYMVINPYWSVPWTIAVKDKLPLLQKDTQPLSQSGYEVQKAGETAFGELAEVDWQNVTAKTFNYVLRQKPGPKNALGKIKFMLPNPHSVYLHDTPDQALFEKQERGFSSGCIRLSEPLALAEWLLRVDEREADIPLFRQLVSGEETRTIHLKNPVPVIMLYMTAFKDEAGSIIFRKDFYQRDSLVLQALRK